MALSITSPVFKNGSPIPALYPAKAGIFLRPCHGATRLPGQNHWRSSWTIPTRPGGTWVHWVIYNIPASASGIQEAAPAQAKLADAV